MEQERKEDDDGNGKECNFFAPCQLKRVSDNLVRSDYQDGVAKNTDDRKRLDEFDVVAKRVAEMVPRECEVAVGTEHFDGRKEDGEEYEQVGFPLDF